MKGAPFRTWLRLLHLWLGLSAGALLVLMGLTGSLLVYQSELDAALNPGLFKVDEAEPGQTTTPPADARRVLEAAAPEGQFVTFMSLPSGAGDVYRAYFGNHERLFHTQVTLDPGQGEILGTRPVGEGLMRFVHTLHFRLHLGGTGRNLVGTIGLLALLLSLSGTVMLYQQSARGSRPLKRWHPRLALYSLPLLVLVLLSGILLALPQYTRPAVEQFSPLSGLDLQLESTPDDRAEDIGLARALDQAGAVMPEATPASVGLPRGESGIYRISLRPPEQARFQQGSAHVVVDRYSGEVLAQRHWSQRSGGDHFMAWLRPLHGGSAFGSLGKALYALLGLLPLLLYITGVRFWLRRPGR